MIGVYFMASKLTEKENILRMFRGEDYEYVPNGSILMRGSVANSALPHATGNLQEDGRIFNIFGVEFVNEGGNIPKPGQFMLDDIRKWRDVIKRPAILDEIDWERQAKIDLEGRDDPNSIRVVDSALTMGYFQALVSFMGFTEGLVALIEEPEEVRELFHFFLELNIENGKKYLHYYKPEMYHGLDDIAHQRAPFVSEEVFLDLIEPMWRAEVSLFREAGCYAQHHNCGYFEPFAPFIADMGYNFWSPQSMNDIVGLLTRLKGKLAMSQGLPFDFLQKNPAPTEEEVREEVRRVMDLYAPAGSYVFSGGFAPPDDEEGAKRSAWILDEYEKNKFKYF